MIRRSLFTIVVLFIILPFMPSTAEGQWGRYYGYYDPYYWSYPWGPYGYYYYDPRPQLRVKVEPEDGGGDDAAVYVDGAYAGVADDLDGTMQGLILSEGRHSVVIFREGFRTAKFNIHLREGSTFKLRHTLTPLAAGERSEPPPTASYRNDDGGRYRSDDVGS